MKIVTAIAAVTLLAAPPVFAQSIADEQAKADYHQAKADAARADDAKVDAQVQANVSSSDAANAQAQANVASSDAANLQARADMAKSQANAAQSQANASREQANASQAQQSAADQAAARAEGKYLGLGLACYVEGTASVPMKAAMSVFIRSRARSTSTPAFRRRGRATTRCSRRSWPTRSASLSRT